MAIDARLGNRDEKESKENLKDPFKIPNDNNYV